MQKNGIYIGRWEKKLEKFVIFKHQRKRYIQKKEGEGKKRGAFFGWGV